MITVEYERRGECIKNLATGDAALYKSINEAKRKSRELQTKGLGRGQLRTVTKFSKL